MSGVLNVGTRALMANMAVLQTTGNNIANVNTPGYSRQTANLQTIEGQFTGGGYIGKGVDLATIERSYSEFLTRQSALAKATSAGDSARAEKLKQLESLFPGGASGLGVALSDMLNAFSDVASAPSDLTARTVALTRVSETAARLRSSSSSLDDLQLGVKQELEQKVSAVNGLAQNIAAVNDKIARVQGNGQAPNDLLDQRDQLVRDLNRYIQTSSVAASDGSVGIFIGGSQALVLGSDVATLRLGSDDYNDPLKSKLTLTRSGQTSALDETLLAGGEVPALLKFQNSDVNEARNLLGRLTLAVTSSMNAQHKLGLDLDGKVGGDLFTPTVFTAANVLEPSAPATLNSGSASLALSIDDVSQFAASDYEISFTAASSGNITRHSDGVVSAFASSPIRIDGLAISISGAANAGDRFLLKPFSTSATRISAEFSTPRALAVASPVAGKMGSANSGSLQLTSLLGKTNPPLVETSSTPVVLTFTGPNSYTRSDEIPPNTTSFSYLAGQAIEGTVPTTTPLSQWSLVLDGAAKAGDTFSVFAIKDASNNNALDLKLNAANASALMNLRDQALFDGAALTDGYASMIAQIGIRTQSANYSAQVSDTIATKLETDRSAVSGVNLDEEASKLIQYQQAYQASAKVIQIAQGIFDTLIQTMSR